MAKEDTKMTRDMTTSATATGGGGDDAEGLEQAGGAREVTFGLAIDAIGRSNATHRIPTPVRTEFTKLHLGDCTWREMAAANVVSIQEALDVVNGVYHTSGVSSGWVGKYGDAPFYQPSIDRLSFLAHNLVAGEFDDELALEPQMYLLDIFSQMFTESFDFHFGFLAQLDGLYHAHQPLGPQGTFNPSNEDTPYAHMYTYWRQVVEDTYLVPGAELVVLPPHLRSGNWRILDVLAEIVTMMAPDGNTLHPEIYLTGKGVMWAKLGSTLGVQTDSSYQDESGYGRFYTPMWANHASGALTTTADDPDAATEVASTGDGQTVTAVGGNSGNSAIGVPVNVAAGSSVSYGLGGLWSQRGVQTMDYNIADTAQSGSLAVSEPPRTFTVPRGTPMTIESIGEYVTVPLVGSYYDSNGIHTDARDYTTNLVELVNLARRIGRSMDTEMTTLLAPAFGLVDNIGALSSATAGMSVQAHDTLFNLYNADYTFSENPARKYSLAHMGPIHDRIEAITVGEVTMTSDQGGQPGTVYQRYWEPPDFTPAEALEVVSFYFPNAEYTKTAAGTIRLSELAASGDIDTALVGRLYSSSNSMHTKLEKPVILPANVGGPEGAYASGVDDSTTAQQLRELFLSAAGAVPFFGLGHNGWTDWQTLDRTTGAPVSDLGLWALGDLGVGSTHYVTSATSSLAYRQSQAAIIGYSPAFNGMEEMLNLTGWSSIESGESDAILWAAYASNRDHRIGTISASSMLVSNPVELGALGGSDGDASGFAFCAAGGDSALVVPTATSQSWGNGSWGHPVAEWIASPPVPTSVTPRITSMARIMTLCNGGDLRLWVDEVTVAGLTIDSTSLGADNGEYFADVERIGAVWCNVGGNIYTPPQGWLGQPGVPVLGNESWTNNTPQHHPEGRYLMQVVDGCQVNDVFGNSYGGYTSTRTANPIYAIAADVNSVHEMRVRTPDADFLTCMLGWANTALSLGDTEAQTTERDLYGFTYRGFPIRLGMALTSLGYIEPYQNMFIGSAYSDTSTWDTDYWIGWRRKDASSDGLMYNANSRDGVSASGHSTWTRSTAAGGSQEVALQPDTEWEWILVCEDSQPNQGDLDHNMIIPTDDAGLGAGPVGSTPAGDGAVGWATPGDPRSGGVFSTDPSITSGQPWDDSDAMLVANGLVVGFTDPGEQADVEHGTYSVPEIDIDLTITALPASTPVGLWSWIDNDSEPGLGVAYGNQSSGNYGTSTFQPSLTFWSGMGSSASTGGVASVGMARGTPVYTIPDEPEKRKVYRPFRSIVDAAVKKEQKLYLIPTHEKLDPTGGPLGLPFYGKESPFRMDVILRASGLPDQYALEGENAKTRLVDASNRGSLTFSKVSMLDMNQGGLQRGIQVMNTENAGFMNSKNKHGSAISGQDVYTTENIRFIQLGKQTQRWT